MWPRRERGGPLSIAVTPLAIEGLLLIEPRRLGDERGYFAETFKSSVLAEHGFTADFVQDNQSLSAQKGVVRGLHFQLPPFAQDKLVRVLKGAILDVAVDIRRDSPTFGHHVAVELSAANFRQLLVPKGFAHGFCTLEPDTEVAYKVTNYYSPECDRGILWNDPALGIQWPVAEDQAILSDKDRRAPKLADMQPCSSWD